MKQRLTLLAGIGLGLITTAGSAQSLGEVDIHGFVSTGYLQSSDNNFHANTSDGTAEFSEIGINFSSEVNDRLRIGAQLFSRDLGETGNHEVKLDWAYGDFHWQDWLGIRAGKIKTPQGLYNEGRDLDLLRTSIFLPQSVYAEQLRDMSLALVGAGAYGFVDLQSMGSISYQIMGGSQNLEEDANAFYALRAEVGGVPGMTVEPTITDAKKIALGLVWETPVDGLRLGYTFNDSSIDTSTHIESGSFAFTSDADYKSITNSVYSLEYSYGDFVFVGEYILTDRDYEQYVSITGRRSNVKKESDGWYVGASYRANEKFEIGAYYSETYNDTSDRDGARLEAEGAGGISSIPAHRAYLKDTCISLRYDVNEYWVAKLEAHSFDGTTSLSVVNNYKWADSWEMIAAKLTFSF